jgi:hypothetical protein
VGEGGRGGEKGDGAVRGERAECPVGQTFGSWTVLGEGPPDPKSGRTRWRVQCKCGATCVRLVELVRRGGVCIRCRNSANRARGGFLGWSRRRRPKAAT